MQPVPVLVHGVHFYPEDGGNIFWQNLGTYLPNYKCHTPVDRNFLTSGFCFTYGMAFVWMQCKELNTFRNCLQEFNL
jgi:hypothetical protein